MPQRTESCFLQCQLWHYSLCHYRVTVAQSNFGGRKGSDAPFGTQRWNRLFSIPLSNKGDGGSRIAEERQSCQGVGGEKAAMLAEPSRRGELGGDRSSCWFADGEHLQHGRLPKKEQAAASSRYTEKAACTSGGWKARAKEMQREP